MQLGHCNSAKRNDDKEILVSLVVVCSDDKHPHRQPECHRHVCIFLRVAKQCYWGGWYSYVTCQRIRPVRLSHMAHRRPVLEFPRHVDLPNSPHCSGALHRCHLSSVVQRKNEWLLRRSMYVECHTASSFGVALFIGPPFHPSNVQCWKENSCRFNPNLFKCMHTYIHTHTHIHMCVCMCVCVYVYVCIH